MADDPDRPGFNDLVTPFIFIKHGDPDPVEWKRAHPGWVSFPATFVPHKRPIPKWTIRNGRRWPMSKKGQPWPSSRFGQPMCPLDEFPPGVPAPGTQGKLIAGQDAKLRETVALVKSGELTAEWFLAERARDRAERAAREAADPIPPPPNAHIYDPLAPARAYLAERAGEMPAFGAAGVSGSSLAQNYRDMMERIDAFGRNLAEGARQRNAMRAGHQAPEAAPVAAQAATPTDAVPSTPVGAVRPPYADLITPVQFVPPGGRGPTRPPRGSLQNPTLPEAARMIRFRYLMRRLREAEPNNPQLTYFAQPNTVPSEAWLARLQAELAAAQQRAGLREPPCTLGSQLAKPVAPERAEALVAELVSNGIKITPANVVRIERMPDGRIAFLEQGDAFSGLEHITKRHITEFTKIGIPQENIPNLLFYALRNGRIVGQQGNDGSRPIYEVVYEGALRRISITVGSNGYVVSANLRGSR